MGADFSNALTEQWPHLLTKFQEEAEGAGFAIVIMTPDDEGGSIGSASPQRRARQNVVFELGFSIGRLESSRVVARLQGDVEIPFDFDGIVYVHLDEYGGWKRELARELAAADLSFDHKAAFSA